MEPFLSTQTEPPNEIFDIAWTKPHPVAHLHAIQNAWLDVFVAQVLHAAFDPCSHLRVRPQL
jgi:hypothetical protein